MFCNRLRLRSIHLSLRLVRTMVRKTELGCERKHSGHGLKLASERSGWISIIGWVSTCTIVSGLGLSPKIAQAQELDPASPDEEEITITGVKEELPQATPTYRVDQTEINKQGANSVAESLRGLPGFAINDVGFGADIHTGTYYRGASINQSVFLLNGRSITTNVNTYHGNIDLNSLPVESIDRIEVSSGSSATLYGSEAFGGVVNIFTKPGSQTPKFNGLVQLGAYGQENYRGSYTGSFGDVDYALGYEQFQSTSDYPVPRGAANRGPDGNLFNGDSATSSYYGRFAWAIDPRNTLTLDGTKITSRKGLLYFGFPLQRDRLNHDAFNTGLNWRSQLAAGSVLNASVGFNKDYFHTFGPTANVFFRQGRLSSSSLNFRLDHDWQLTRSAQLRWGLDAKTAYLTSETTSNNPAVNQFNEVVETSRFTPALFALGTLQLTPTLRTELGLRQNFSGDFGSSLNPSVGLNWLPNRTIGLRGSWVSVRRLPGLDQQFAYDTVHNWFPNENLQPESGSSWTAGIDFKPSPQWAGQVTYFGSALSDRIAIQATPRNGRTISQWQNIGKVNTHGLELALQYQLSPQWKTFLNYTYTDARIGSGVEKGLQLAQVPFSVGQFGIGYEHQGWQINLYANYFSGARRAIFVNPGESPRDFSPSWLNVDLSARIPITRRLGLLLYLENLGGRTYEKVNRLYQPGTTIRIGLNSEF
ncbi:TonB-dependent receptor [Alkalinema sp. FACHB-956]|nr:TonB-dependent receptor [Alkalinema sp. FACHB-956]